MSSLVSIITPTYDSRRFIGATYDSLIGQTYRNWEWIVVDDCSNDDTYEYVQALSRNDNRIKLYSNTENSGAAISRNQAIEKAQGRFIAFLDSDDIWKPDKLAKQVDFMLKNGVPFSYSAYEKIDERGNALGEVVVPDKVGYKDLLKVSTIGCLTAIYDTDVLGKVYMPLIRKRQDLGLWLRILKEIPYAYSTPGVLAQYRVRSDSISSNKRVAAQYTWKLYREVEGMSLIKATYYFIHYAFNGIVRTKLPSLARALGWVK